MAKAVRLRQRAEDDIEAVTDRYLREVDAALAGRFVDEVEQAFRHLGRHPQTGSLRFSYELDLPGLRTWPLPTSPHLVFYVDQPDHVDVWRLLHGARDLPRWLVEPT